MDYGKIVSQGLFAWNRNSTAIKDAVWLGFLYLLVSLFLLVLGALLFGSVENYLNTSYGMQSDYTTVPLGGAILLVVVSGLLGLALFFVQYFFIGRIIRQALLQYETSLPTFNFAKGIRLAFLGIASFLVAVFCWYNKRWLGLLLLAVVLFLLALFGVLASGGMLVFLVSSAIFIIFFTAYLFVLMYNSIRISLAQPVFVQKEQGISASLREAWGLANKKVLRILIAQLLMGIVLLVIVLVISIPAIATSFFAASSTQLLLPATLLEYITSALTTALALLISGFALAELYRQILAEPVETKPPIANPINS